MWRGGFQADGEEGEGWPHALVGEGNGGQLLAEEISLVNSAPAGGSSQCRLSPLAARGASLDS